MKRSVERWTVFAAFLTLSACSDGDSTGPDAREVAAISITPESPQLVVGATAQLTATLRDQDGSAFTTAPAGVEVVWSSAASSIATVSQTGLVQGTGPGTARITAAAAGRSAFVDVTVTSANTAPVAVDDSVTLVQGTSLDIDVVANDSDADGDDLTPSILTQPVHGAAMLQGGAIRYTPDVGYVGVDQFDYTIADGNEGMDTATVFISITPAEFSETQHSVGMTTLVYHDGAFYNVFHESRAGDADVYLRTSEDGIAWSDRVLVSDGLPGTSQHSGSVAVWGSGAGTRVAVAYEDNSTANPQLRVAVSMDGGESFQPSVPVSLHTDNNAIRGNIAAGADGVLYMAWARQYSGDRWDHVWFSASADAGASWSAPAQIYNSGHYGSDVHVAAGAAGEVWVAVSVDASWKKDVRVLRSTDSGATWLMQSVSNNTQTNHMGDHPALLHAADGSLYVAWQNTVNRSSEPLRVLVSRSTDGGATWSAPALASDSVALGVNTATYNSRIRPSLTEGPDGTIYAVWADDRQGPAAALDARNYDIYVSSSTDSGSTWSADTRVNDMPEIHEQAFPSIAAGPAGVLVVWRDQRLAPWHRLHHLLNP